MIRSMTGFAREEQQTEWGQICWEIRSVNHRYLDISIRLPEEFRLLEMTIREHIQQQVKRGKVDCFLRLQLSDNTEIPFNVNIVLVKRLWEAVQAISQVTRQSIAPSSLEILRWPNVLTPYQPNMSKISESVLQQFDHVLTQLITQREREGTQLAVFLEQKCAAIANEIVQIKQELPLILQKQRETLETRLAELIEINHERLEQEVVLIAQKMDVTEELERLEIHLQEIRQILTQDNAVGRRLDFLVQELHREANTLGAKANHLYTTRSVLELKVLIEQIREQTQNIE